MTKLRAPGTYAEATARVAGLLGYPEAGRIVDRSDRTIYEWANPDSATSPTLAQAEALDTAYILAGGDGAPFADALAFRSGMASVEQSPCQRELADHLAVAMREAGQAFAAALPVTQFNASPHAIMRALAEVEEADTAIGAVKRCLALFLTLGTGSDAGLPGGEK